MFRSGTMFVVVLLAGIAMGGCTSTVYTDFLKPALNKVTSVVQNLDVTPTPDCQVGDRDCDPFGE